MKKVGITLLALSAALLLGGCETPETDALAHIRVLPDQDYHNGIALAAHRLKWHVCQYGPKSYRVDFTDDEGGKNVMRMLYSDFGYLIEPDPARTKVAPKDSKRYLDRLNYVLEYAIAYGRSLEEKLPIEACPAEKETLEVQVPEFPLPFEPAKINEKERRQNLGGGR